jgi:hypothetical protein
VTGEESPTGVNASCSPIIKHKDGRLNLNYRQVCSRILCGEKDRLCNLIAATWPHNAQTVEVAAANSVWIVGYSSRARIAERRRRQWKSGA